MQSFSDPQHTVEQLGLTEGMQVADLGAGSGHYALAAARGVGNTGVVYAVDLQDSLLSRLVRLGHAEGVMNIEIIHADLEKERSTTLRDETMDVVIAANIFFQITHKDVFTEEIKRILKPGGRLLLVDWSESFNGMGPQEEHVLGATEARTQVERFGLTHERDITAGAHHYGLIARKPKN